MERMEIDRMKQWVTKRYQADYQKIAQEYHISEVLAELLVKRGLFDWKAINRFLFPERETTYPAEQMKGLCEAAEMLEQKIRAGRAIRVIGDYDVDGVMAVYILYQGITMLGGRASYRIPHRIQDGYGMRTYMAEEAYAQGCDTILTCDNGISAADAVARAKELGMDVIITDHHEVPKAEGRELLPPADVIVDPKQEACGYPFKELCGAGIAYRLMQVLFAKFGREEPQKELLPFAAVATVCDVVPLLDENRMLVRKGLQYINQREHTGMRALIEALQFQRDLNSLDIGFRIGPCINAAGRLGDAAESLELLLEKDWKTAERRAAELVARNEERKEYTAQAVQCAVEQIEQQDYLKQPVLVVALADCHESVAGIVAGRVRERYYRPTLIITRSRNGWKGSARSIPGYHMQQELNRCSELLKEYGGHAMAAGFSLAEENLLRLRQALNENCTLQEDELTEKLYFDREVPLGEMTEAVVKELKYLEPFGEKNEKPVFAKREVALVSVSFCGKENQIARLRLKDGVRVYHGVDFLCEDHLKEGICGRYGEDAWEAIRKGQCREYVLDILYQPEINQMYGNVEFRIVDCR